MRVVRLYSLVQMGMQFPLSTRALQEISLKYPQGARDTNEMQMIELYGFYCF